MNKLFAHIILVFFIATVGISQTLFQKKVTNCDFNDIILTDDGGFITCGVLPYNNPNIPPNASIIKIDINGNIQWAKQYSAIQTGGNFGSIIQTKDGGYIALAGYNTSTNSANPNFLPFIVKTDVNGNIQWSKIGYSNPIYGNLFIRQTFDKGYAIVCNTFLQGGSNIQFIKIDSSGNMIWNKLYMSGITINPIISTSFIQTIDGGYFMTAGISLQYGGAFYTSFFKMDDQGNVEWSKIFTASDGNTGGGHAIQTKDRGYILSDAEAAGTLAKLDSVGNIVWERILYELPNLSVTTNDVYNYNNNGLVYTNDGGFAIFGNNNFLIKTDSLGVLQWAKKYKKTYGFYCGVQIIDNEGSAGGFAALGGLSYPNMFMIKTDQYGNSVCDSNITVIDSLITPATTTSFSMTVTSAGTMISNITTVASSINIADSVLCIGTVGITEIKNTNEEISVYPNPAHSIVYVSSNEQLVDIKVFDVLGSEILQTKQKEIDISSLPNGVYFIHIETSAGIKTKKVILQH